MFLHVNGLLNGETNFPTPKMLLIMFPENFQLILKMLLTLILRLKLKLWHTR